MTHRTQYTYYVENLVRMNEKIYMCETVANAILVLASREWAVGVVDQLIEEANELLAEANELKVARVALVEDMHQHEFHAA